MNMFIKVNIRDWCSFYNLQIYKSFQENIMKILYFLRYNIYILQFDEGLVLKVTCQPQNSQAKGLDLLLKKKKNDSAGQSKASSPLCYFNI